MLKIVGFCRRQIATTSADLKGPKNYVNRRTGRGAGNSIMPRFSWRFDKAMGKYFQKSMAIKFGVDTGLDDKLLLLSIASKQRRLDEKKMKQLSQIIEEKVGDVISTDETLAALALQISKVTVDKSFSNVNIYWICKGEGDDEVRTCLENNRHSMRRKIGEIIGISCPELKFIGDKALLMEKEMDNLFKKADYGMDYRMLSQTSRVLGNVEEKNEKKSEKEAKTPKWLESVREKKLRKLK